MRQRRPIVLVAVLAIVSLAASSSNAGAQDGGCMLDGQRYPENATVCSNGLVLFCTNGVWQNNDGARCDAPSGAYVGSRRPLTERNPEPVPDHYKEKYPGLNLQ